MKNLRPSAVLFTILVAASCVSHPNRPDAPMCGHLGDCHDGRGDFNEDPRLLLCTTPDGYSYYQNYIGRLELRIRQLERRCGQKEERVTGATERAI